MTPEAADLDLESPELERPIFLVGTVRSASTLTARCLGQHPRVRYVGAERRTELSAEWEDVGGAPNWRTCPPMDAGDVRGDRRRALRRCFARLFAEDGGRPGEHFLNKSPHLSNKLPYVKALFPDARLAVTGRDLRSTVASTRLLWERGFENRGIRHFLPRQKGYCWSCSPPLPLEETEPARTFPGGDASVLAEYWLSTYESIDAHLELFEHRTVILHRDLTASPGAVLVRAFRELDLEASEVELPEPIQPGRNLRWREILSQKEQDDLDRFIDRHRGRIEGLRSADTVL